MENTLANVDLGRYRRIVQMFWDPEPTNNAHLDQPVWCLGCTYKLSDTSNKHTTAAAPAAPVTSTASTVDSISSIADQTSVASPPEEQPEPNQREPDQPETVKLDTVQPETVPLENVQSETVPSETVQLETVQPKTEPPKQEQPKPVPAPPHNAPETPPESGSSSFSSALAYDDTEQGGGWPHAFIDDFESRFWMTYRSEFEPIARSTDPKAASTLSLSMRIKTQLGDPTGFSSDSGWGCMIRSGQSLLANTIALLRLGRDWRRGTLELREREVVRMFADDPRAPYSIHNFVQHGATACGKYPGEWFGPSATARCIQALTNANEPLLRVYSTGDGPDVYEDSFMKIAKSDGTFHPTLILVGTRLGIDKITPVYWEALIASLQMPQSVGIAGGRPSSAHYFAGAQGSFLFYLDPHHTRKALPFHADPNDYTEEEVDSCHTARLRRIHVREMDPSMLIGFLIRSEEDWAEWRRNIKHVQGKAIIHVADRDPRLLGVDGLDGRAGAIDEVEPLSDDDDDTILDA